MKKLFFSLVGGLILTSLSLMAKPDSKTSEEMRTVCYHTTLECGVSGTLCGENQENYLRNLNWAIAYYCDGGRESLM